MPPGTFPPLSLDFGATAVSGDPVSSTSGVSLGNYSKGIPTVGWIVIGVVAVVALKKLV